MCLSLTSAPSNLPSLILGALGGDGAVPDTCPHPDKYASPDFPHLLTKRALSSWRQKGQHAAHFAPYLIPFRAGVPQAQPLERSTNVLTGMGTDDSMSKTVVAQFTLQI